MSPETTAHQTQPPRRIVGIDLSLTATGVAGDIPCVFHTKMRGVERLAAIRDAILRVTDQGDRVTDQGDTLVVLEGYSYASGHQAHQLGELGGVVRLALHEAQVVYVDVPPSTLKKFATGKGNANKAAMGLAAARAGYDGPGDDNAIDAWWLQVMGFYAAGGLRLNPTAYRDQAVATIDWPAA